MATSGPSGAVVTVHAGASVWASRRSKGRCSARERRAPCVGAPRAGQRLGEVGLLGGDVGGPVAQAPGLDEQHLRVRGQRGRAARARPRCSHGSHDSMPSKVRPSASRSHCSRPHGSSGDQPLGPAAGPRRWAAARGTGRSRPRSRSTVDALVGDGELGEAVDLVAPQVDAHRHVGGRREHVDDRAPHRDLAAVLDLVLAPVAGGDELLDELGRVDAGRPGATTIGSTSSTWGPSRCTSARTGATTTRGARAGSLQPPHRAQPAAHRLDARADPLERQRLPRREQLDRVRRRGRRARSWASRSASPVVGTATSERMPLRRGGEPGDDEGPGGLGHGQVRDGAPQHLEEGGVVAEQRRQVEQRHGSSSQGIREV